MNQALLSILVTNHFGVLTKVTGLFSRRGFNIKALSVGETENKAVSRITIHTEGDDLKLQQIYHQVSKLEDVKAANILPGGNFLERELVLVKVDPKNKREEFLQALIKYGAKYTDFQGGCVIVEACGCMDEMVSLIEELKGFNIIEISRTGPTALEMCCDSLSNKYKDKYKE